METPNFEKSLDYIAILMHKLEELTPEYYFRSDTVAEINDFLRDNDIT